MTPILILEAFGELPATDLVAAERARERHQREHPTAGVVDVSVLHRAFEARAELMGWSVTSRHVPLPAPLWNLFEANLTDGAGDSSLIGWVYVGLANPIGLSQAAPETVQPGTGAGWGVVRPPPGYHEATVALPVAIPLLVQCLDDSLRRIGADQITGFQLTCYGADLQPNGRYGAHLASGASWFNITPKVEAANALIAFDAGLTGGVPISDLLRVTGYRNDFPCAFEPVRDISWRHNIRTPSNTPKPHVAFEPSALSLSVGLPEWTASSAGWALAAVVDAARSVAPGVENFSVRITRVR